ncbi:MAG TPA: FAD-dependent oxidoreductase, partial [Acidimicrobiales bacterium]|nr:FAD-dependent oxidoreductase [Acidimicrobiales bacterium]
DPVRRPGYAWSTVRSPVGGVADKARTVALVADVLRHSPKELLRRPDTTTAARLARAGFSEAMVEEFWRPLFAGIQLDPGLEVSSRRFDIVLRMLATGTVGVPERGIGAVSEQLAEGLPVRLRTPVESVAGTTVVLQSGERVTGRAVVVATDGPTAHRLLGSAVPDPGSRPVACCWFSAPAAPVAGPLLVLDGERSGPAMNVAVMSEVWPGYAPPGRALIAAAVPGPAALDPAVTGRVREQLSRWWGAMTTDWQELRTDVIPHGQPLQAPPLRLKRRVGLGDGVFVCGDHRGTASAQGAMFSGGRAASAVVSWLAGGAGHQPTESGAPGDAGHQPTEPGTPLNGPTTHDVTQPP